MHVHMGWLSTVVRGICKRGLLALDHDVRAIDAFRDVNTDRDV